MSDQVPLPDNGRAAFHTTTCPACGRSYSWMSGISNTGWLTCDNETERGVKCGHKLRVMEWEYLRWREEKRNAKVSR